MSRSLMQLFTRKRHICILIIYQRKNILVIIFIRIVGFYGIRNLRKKCLQEYFHDTVHS